MGEYVLDSDPMDGVISSDWNIGLGDRIADSSETLADRYRLQARTMATKTVPGPGIRCRVGGMGTVSNSEVPREFKRWCLPASSDIVELVDQQSSTRVGAGPAVARSPLRRSQQVGITAPGSCLR